MSIRRDMSVLTTELCADADKCWTVREPAEHTGISGFFGVLNFVTFHMCRITAMSCKWGVTVGAVLGVPWCIGLEWFCWEGDNIPNWACHAVSVLSGFVGKGTTYRIR